MTIQEYLQLVKTRALIVSLQAETDNLTKCNSLYKQQLKKALKPVRELLDKHIEGHYRDLPPDVRNESLRLANAIDWAIYKVIDINVTLD